ncbi:MULTISPECIES: PCP family exopolysaccharide biosynthesis protein EpsV [Corallococcus]|uniref:PCP family exopolysaccharide biosynthesis protein EpsV n=1 Tax=Corallococcus TaxID=83461 RepID=UPI00117F559E|nr:MULTISPECIES: PCP family exopolysaccharide biosynthesis protein EpsV [Corallococcus]NBD12780.1 chain-length determining protein [Corallococcus silvisoli]TSC23149.1 chain-length determining protein [Corallococcus sp. Z5C101001]
MTTPAPRTPRPAPPPAYVPEREETNAPADLIDWGFLFDGLGFVRRAILRHWFLGLCIIAVMSGLGSVAAKLMPRKYHVETRMLTYRNLIISSLVNPGRSIPVEADQPTRAAWEMVLSRGNLKSVVKNAKLIEYWDLMRSPLSRAKEQYLKKAPPPMTDEEKEEALIAMLETSLNVMAEGGSGTVTIGVDWSDPQLAFNIVEAASQNFLDMRHDSEMGAISESVNILQGQVANEAANIKQAIADLERAVKQADARRKKKEADPKQASARQALLQTDHALAQLKFLVQAKRRAIRDVEEFRGRRLTELRAQLAEQRVVFSPQHPVIVDLEQRVAAMQQDTPQLTALRSEEQSLIQEYLRMGGTDVESATEGTSLGAGGPLAGALLGTPDDPEVAVATDRMRMVVMRHQEKLRRLDQAQTELEISKASMKHRYSVLLPALFPEKPSKPNPKLIAIAGVVGGVALAVFAAVALDILRRRVLEKWQVERLLKLPVLAELERR